jgi:predicted acylesterase/phospholipase RssA
MSENIYKNNYCQSDKSINIADIVPIIPNIISNIPENVSNIPETVCVPPEVVSVSPEVVSVSPEVVSVSPEVVCVSPEVVCMIPDILSVSESIKNNNYDTLVLSGGSINGIIFLGALQYCSDTFYLTDIVTYIGTSVGSMIGYLLAIGYTPIEIMVYIFINHVFDKIKQFDIVAAINGSGATSFSHIHEHLEKMTIEKIGKLITLKDLYIQFGKKLICTTYNLTKDKAEYLSYENYPDMPCLIAIRMSANLPLVFDRFKYLGSEYIDGAITDNFPISVAEEHGSKILGLYIKGKRSDVVKNKSETGILEYIHRLMHIPIKQSVEFRMSLASEKCSLLCIETKTKYFFEFNISAVERFEMFSDGYTEGKEFFEKKSTL